jgi:hypothetical protein
LKKKFSNSSKARIRRFETIREKKSIDDDLKASMREASKISNQRAGQKRSRRRNRCRKPGGNCGKRLKSSRFKIQGSKLKTLNLILNLEILNINLWQVY